MRGAPSLLGAATGLAAVSVLVKLAFVTGQTVYVDGGTTARLSFFRDPLE